ncbi:MAG: mechanosensitive ion channel domain-containing protein [Pseudomonadota bacterium]
MEFLDLMTDGVVPAYIAAVIAIQVTFTFGRQVIANRRARRRAAAGLPEDEMLGSGEALARLRWSAGLQAFLFIAAVLCVPAVFVVMTDDRHIALALVAFLAMVIINVPEPMKHAIGGLAFKSLMAMERPFQIGDRVHLKGISGRVVDIGIFYVTLQTPNDDAISVPSYGLWSEVLSSTNAGDKASLAVVEVHLSPFCNQSQRRGAESGLREAIQASPYFDIARPLHVFVSQSREAITLMAKAYVASTYDEPHFVSDVTRAFLDYASEAEIPLAVAEPIPLLVTEKPAAASLAAAA